MSFIALSRPKRELLALRVASDLQGFELSLYDQANYWRRQRDRAGQEYDFSLYAAVEKMDGRFPLSPLGLLALRGRADAPGSAGPAMRREAKRQLRSLVMSLLLRQLIAGREKAGLTPMDGDVIFDIMPDGTRWRDYRLHVNPEDSRRVLGEAEADERANPDRQWYYDASTNIFVLRTAPASHELSREYIADAARHDREYDITGKITLCPYVGMPLDQSRYLDNQ